MCAPFCRSIRFLQKVHPLQISTEICRRYTLCRFLQKFAEDISAEKCAPFCIFLQKSADFCRKKSAERGTLSADLFRNL
jgi:hypothetical protein